MKIVITAGEALNRGMWEKICDLKGFNVWAINEGLLDESYEIILTEEDAKKLGILKGD